METESVQSCDIAANEKMLAPADSRRRTGQLRDHATHQHLYATCLPALRRWTQRRFARCDMHDADDLVQTALLRALRRIDAFEARGDGSFLAYLRQIVFNEVRRQNQRQRQRGEAVAIDESLHEACDPVLDAMLEHERSHCYARALRQLNRRQRMHLALRVEHGMSFEEIAREVGGSADGARMIVTRALRAMSTRLAAA